MTFIKLHKSCGVWLSETVYGKRKRKGDRVEYGDIVRVVVCI